MKKIVRLTESDLISVVRKIINEGNFDEKLSNTSFTDKQRKKIKKLGIETLKNIKNWSEGSDNIKEVLNKHGNGLSLEIPNESFLRTNLEHIKFAMKYLPLSKGKYYELKENQELIELQLNSPNVPHLLLFHEKEGEQIVWSVVNLYDTNLTLWFQLMNNRYDNSKKESIDEFIENYFEGGPESKASYDLLNSILRDREVIATDIFKKTWGYGQNTERDFANFLSELGFSVKNNNLKFFAGGGNYVDKIGIDLAVKINSDWIPIQVKSSMSAAQKAIPYGGISVFPYNEKFSISNGKLVSTYEYYCFEDRNKVPKKIEEFFF